MSDMTKDVFAEQSFGKVALKKLSPVPENFRLYAAGWLDDERTVMRVTGCGHGSMQLNYGAQTKCSETRTK